MYLYSNRYLASLLPVSSEIWKWKCDVILTYWLGKYTENTSMIWYSVVSTNNKRNDMTRKWQENQIQCWPTFCIIVILHSISMNIVWIVMQETKPLPKQRSIDFHKHPHFESALLPTETGYICDIIERWKLLYHFWHNIIFRQYRLCKEHTSVRGWCFIFSKRIKSK